MVNGSGALSELSYVFVFENCGQHLSEVYEALPPK
jgi:hypothetical protein